MSECAKCGSQLPEGSAFCNSCGAHVEPEGVPAGAAVTTQMPVVPPAPPASGPVAASAAMPVATPTEAEEPRGGNRTLLIVVIVLLVVLLCGVGGTIAYLVGQNRSPDGASEEPSATVAATMTLETPTATDPAVDPDAGGAGSDPAEGGDGGSAPAPSGPDTADDGRQFLKISRMYKEGGEIKAEVDFMQLFMGQEAWDEAAARGEEAPNDYYVVNDNPRLRTFPVNANADVEVAFGGDPNATEVMTGEQFYDRVLAEPGVKGWGYYFVIAGGRVTAIENFWTP